MHDCALGREGGPSAPRVEHKRLDWGPLARNPAPHHPPHPNNLFFFRATAGLGQAKAARDPQIPTWKPLDCQKLRKSLEKVKFLSAFCPYGYSRFR